MSGLEWIEADTIRMVNKVTNEVTPIDVTDYNDKVKEVRDYIDSILGDKKNV